MDDPQTRKQLLRRSRGTFEVPVLDQQMEPTLRDGDVVRVNADHGFVVGDIVLVRDGERLLLRRVILAPEPLDTARVVTCGDAAAERDPPSAGRVVIGVAVSVRTAGGTAPLDRGLGLADRLSALLLRASTPRRGWRRLARPLRRAWFALCALRRRPAGARR